MAKCKECKALLTYRTNASNLLAHATKHDKYRKEVEKLRREKLERPKQPQQQIRRAQSKTPTMHTNYDYLNEFITSENNMGDRIAITATAAATNLNINTITDMWGDCRYLCKEEGKFFLI